MIISRGRSYIFVHIPKTGGTSMALALEARAMKDDMMLGDTPKAIKRRRKLSQAKTHGRLWKHSTLADIDGMLSPEDIAQMFCFTLVRNPWNRVVSYYFWLREQDFEHPAVARAKAMSFESFVCDPDTIASFRASPASHYMTDITGTERCAAFVRLEHLATDLAPVEAHLGFKLELTRENKTRRNPDWRQYYSNASQKAVESACQADILRFGYAFED